MVSIGGVEYPVTGWVVDNQRPQRANKGRDWRNFYAELARLDERPSLSRGWSFQGMLEAAKN